MLRTADHEEPPSEDGELPTSQELYPSGHQASADRREGGNSQTDEPITPLHRAQSTTNHAASLDAVVPNSFEDIASLPDPTTGIAFTSEWTSGCATHLSDTSENAGHSGVSAVFYGEVTKEPQYPYASASTAPGLSGRQIQTSSVPRAPFRSSDALEAQPSTSVGYEWDEWSPHSRKDHDGYASLSIDAEGKGYLGESVVSKVIFSSQTRLCIRIDCPSYTANLFQIYVPRYSGRIASIHNRKI